MTDNTQARATPVTAQSTTTTPLPTSGETAHNECPECGASEFQQAQDGNEYCQSCGLVVSDVPIERSEPGWREYSERRLGPSSSVSWERVGTMIGTGEDAAQAARLTKYHNRLDYATRALQSGLREVRSLASKLDLPSSTEEHAAHHYRRALAEGLLQGRSQESVAGACVYAASRRYHQPVTLADVAAASPVDEPAISGAYRVLLKELDIGLRPPEPSDFLAKIATSAGVEYRVERRAFELLERATDDGKHVGQNPAGVAAAALYAGAQELSEPLTQAEVADAAGISTVTLSRQWQAFRDYIE